MRSYVLSGILSGWLFAAAVPPALSAQQLTPRDAFWSASDLVSVAANPAAKKKPQHTAPPATKQTTAPTLASAKARQATPAGQDVAPSPAPHVAAELVAENGYGAQPHLTRVSSHQLGLRYSLLLRDADRSYEEVASNTVFHSGEHIRLSIMANESGYLYVIQKGSSGSWSSIFPAPGSAKDSNRVEGGAVKEIPGGTGAFQLNPPAGSEHLFVILSRQPIRDLDTIIERLKEPGESSTQPNPRPAPAGQMLEASNRIPDELIQRLASRDLALVQEQEVDQPPTATNSGEKAVYVVAKATPGTPSGEVITRITLRHE